MKRIFCTISILGILLSGCKKDNDAPTTPATKTYTSDYDYQRSRTM